MNNNNNNNNNQTRITLDRPLYEQDEVNNKFNYEKSTEKCKCEVYFFVHSVWGV